MQKPLNIEEIARLLNHVIDTNKELQENGKTPVAFSISGPQGIGKTDIVKQVAEKRNMGFVKLSLHELEEVGDLVGYPMKEFRIISKATGKESWVAYSLLDKVNTEKFNITSKSRMSYAKPAWVPEYNENGTILLLDDYARSSQMLVQATMELINTGKYVSWELPKGTTIVLTANPDNGEFNVQTLDPAQKNRFVEYPMDYDINSWAKWAEANDIDSRAINFALNYSHELFDKNESGAQIATPRGYVTFCKVISSIKDWKRNLDLIVLISHGCFNDKDNAVGGIFGTFIANGYDKLVTPREVFSQTWETVHPKLRKALYGDDPDNNLPNHAVASMMTTRIINWIDVYFNKPGYVSATINDRLKEIFDSHLIPEDDIFHIIKSIVSKHAKQCAKLLSDPNIISKVTL